MWFYLAFLALAFAGAFFATPLTAFLSAFSAGAFFAVFFMVFRTFLLVGGL